MNQKQLTNQAKYLAQDWGARFRVRPSRMSGMDAMRLVQHLQMIMNPQSSAPGVADPDVVTAWDSGMARPLGDSFRKAASKYQKAGMLGHFVGVLDHGIKKTDEFGLTKTNHNLELVLGHLLPIVYHPQVLPRNRGLAMAYDLSLNRIFQSPQRSHPALRDALTEANRYCEDKKIEIRPGLRAKLLAWVADDAARDHLLNVRNTQEKNSPT